MSLPNAPVQTATEGMSSYGGIYLSTYLIIYCMKLHYEFKSEPRLHGVRSERNSFRRCVINPTTIHSSSILNNPLSLNHNLLWTGDVKCLADRFPGVSKLSVSRGRKK
uniref:Uncharacterized protein n=1 Tax=Cacopsylla melanoneura TaxID=428564 RepID=A0A8D8ZD61_9HEMI